MIVLDKRPLSMAQVKEQVKDLEDKKELESYLKRFSKSKLGNAKKIEEEIIALENPKVREEDVIKIVDFLPKDAEDLNKILIEVSLTEDETNQIIDIVKKHRN